MGQVFLLWVSLFPLLIIYTVDIDQGVGQPCPRIVFIFGGFFNDQPLAVHRTQQNGYYKLIYHLSFASVVQ
jgi:hypothetical protein